MQASFQFAALAGAAGDQFISQISFSENSQIAIYIHMETHACTLQTYGRDQTIKQKKFRRGERSFAGSLCHTKERTERTTLGHAPKNQDQSHDHDDVPVLSHVSIVWSAV